MFKTRTEPWYRRFFRPSVAADLILWPLLVGLPFAIRGYHLADVPSAREPVDLATIGQVEIAAEDNACPLYGQAAGAFVLMSREAYDEYAASCDDGPEAIGQALRTAIEANRAALDLFREASERPDYLRNKADEAASNSTNAAIRDLARLTEIEAIILQESGDVDSAWAGFRSTLRCGRHLGRNSNSNQRLVGRALHLCAIRRIVSWAESPLVDATRLTHALRESRAIYRTTPPTSTALKLDYLWCRHVLDTPSLHEPGLNQSIFINRAEWNCRWFLGEPELSRTIVRATFENWLSQCDKPPYARPPRASGHLQLFAAAPEAIAEGTQIPPDLIESLVCRSFIAPPIVCSSSFVITCLDTESAWQALLEFTLSLQIHYRETGAFPESPDDLLGTSLDALPVDPFGLTSMGQSVPLRYRRELDPLEGFTIWSIGPDGIDDEGRLPYPTSVGHDTGRGDILVSVKPPK